MRLLVIEKSGRARDRLSHYLREAGYLVDEQSDPDEGSWAAKEGGYDVVLLDMALPGADPRQILRGLREANSLVHVLAISACDGLEDRLEALDAGADDCVAKSFDVSEALARVRALVRRSYARKSPTIRISDLEIDPMRRAVFRAGTAIPLTALEYRLLEYLGFRAGEVASRADIWERVFEDANGGTSNAIEVYISSLRKKLKATGGPDLIRTLRGHGYTLQYSGE